MFQKKAFVFSLKGKETKYTVFAWTKHGAFKKFVKEVLPSSDESIAKQYTCTKVG